MSRERDEVWVSGYTTSTGVEVAGHWRRRSRPAPADGTEIGSGEDRVSPQEGPRSIAPPVASTSSGLAPPPATTSSVAPYESGMLVARPRPATSAEVTTARDLAQRRYAAAQAAVGIATLRKRRTGDGSLLRTALAERAEARSSLCALTQDASAATDKPDTSRGDEEGPAHGEEANRCGGCGQFRGSGHQCPAGMVYIGGDYAGMSQQERAQAMLADLEKSVQAIVESGQLGRWLDAMASNGLTRWSARNRMLAVMQMAHKGKALEDLHMMGFRQWQNRYGRTVTESNSAAWILAPNIRRAPLRGDDGKPLRDKDGKPLHEEQLMGFKPVKVFDISSTEGPPLPESPISVARGEATAGTLEGLQSRVAEAGYAYEEAEIPGCNPQTGIGTLGYTEPESKRIVVDSRLSGAQKASVIAHELGHVHCGHVDRDYDQYLKHRGRMETEAEMTAYMVNRSRGMPRATADAFSPGYIAMWSNGKPERVTAAMDTSTKAYNKIMAGDWPGLARKEQQ